MVFTVLLLSIAVSMDALGIGISYRLRNVRFSKSALLVVFGLSVLMTAGAVLIGRIFAGFMPEVALERLGAGVLFVLGLSALCGAFRVFFVRVVANDKLFSVAIKPLGVIVHIVRAAYECDCDFDSSSVIDAKEAVYLGVALSLDAFVASLSMTGTPSGVNLTVLPLAVGVVQTGMLMFGEVLGARIGKSNAIPGWIWQCIAACILIFIAILRVSGVA